MLSACDVDPLPIAVIVIAADGQITTINERARELFGERTVGRLYAAVLRQPDVVERIERALAHERMAPVRYIAVGAGRDVVYDAHIVPIEDESGGVMVSFVDATHKEEAGQMRSDFVANVSHELRTPLTALSGFIETLRGPARDDPEARDRFLDIMEQEAGRMNRLVSDLLSLSRVEDMERMRPTAPQDLRDVLHCAQSSLQRQARARGVTIDLVSENDGGIAVSGDRDQLIQVFTNLIENAMKYGKKAGIVTIRVTRGQAVPGMRAPVICVAVEDQGDGIAPHHIGRLTERFYRVDNHRSREMGGTGLGLAIVKHIVKRHRGRLRIQSEKGKGSCFTVCLPEHS